MSDIPGAANKGRAAVDVSAARAGKYLTFRLSAEEYGVEILRVREIIGIMDITHVPRTPDYIRGVINLRGKIVPVLDLKTRLDMGVTEDSDQCCIVVLEVILSNESVRMGVLVDAVTEVVEIHEEQIDDAPEFGSGIDSRFIRGMARVGESVKILLDIDRIMGGADIGLPDNITDEMQQV
jgi:purine-binding chemotaxis protein CheW